MHLHFHFQVFCVFDFFLSSSTSGVYPDTHNTLTILVTVQKLVQPNFRLNLQLLLPIQFFIQS